MTTRSLVEVDSTNTVKNGVKVPAAQVTGATGSVSVSGATLTFTSADGKTTSTATLPANGGASTSAVDTGIYTITSNGGAPAAADTGIYSI